VLRGRAHGGVVLRGRAHGGVVLRGRVPGGAMGTLAELIGG
jgi:hypothetical protein